MSNASHIFQCLHMICYREGLVQRIRFSFMLKVCSEAQRYFYLLIGASDLQKTRRGTLASQIASRGKRKGWRMVTPRSLCSFVIHLSPLKGTFDFRIPSSAQCYSHRFFHELPLMARETGASEISSRSFSRCPGCISLGLEHRASSPPPKLQRSSGEEQAGCPHCSCGDSRRDLEHQSSLGATVQLKSKHCLAPRLADWSHAV